MAKRSDLVLLLHMRDFAQEAVGIAEGRHRQDLEGDAQLTRSLERLIEIIGEAASKTSENLRASSPQVPWRQIIGMRNILVHMYEEVDHDRLWATVTHDLPALIRDLKEILGKMPAA